MPIAFTKNQQYDQQTKKVLEDILQSTKTVSRVVSTIGVQRMDEISLKSMLQKLVSPFKKLFSRLKMNTKRIDNLNGVLKSMVT